MESGKVYAVWNVLDGIKSIERIHAAENAGIADNAAPFHGGQRIFYGFCTDKLKSFGGSLNDARELPLVQDLLVRVEDQL